ncbi:MAG TPA: hypothetical protein VNN07_11505, partial [Candidatus Tectomicrobia bacterium]|nr:hypothetical protein [Candidatus Tectomicrobia bacterium]
RSAAAPSDASPAAAPSAVAAPPSDTNSRPSLGDKLRQDWQTIKRRWGSGAEDFKNALERLGRGLTGGE